MTYCDTCSTYCSPSHANDMPLMLHSDNPNSWLKVSLVSGSVFLDFLETFYKVCITQELLQRLFLI